MDSQSRLVDNPSLHRVGKHPRRTRCAHCDLEWSLESRLVETRKHTPRRSRLELRPGVPIVGHLGVKQTVRGRADPGAVFEAQGQGTCGKLQRKVQPRDAGRAYLRITYIEGLVAPARACPADFEILPMDEDTSSRGRQLSLDFNMTAETARRGIDSQIEQVQFRLHCARQRARRRRWHRLLCVHWTAPDQERSKRDQNSQPTAARPCGNHFFLPRLRELARPPPGASRRSVHSPKAASAPRVRSARAPAISLREAPILEIPRHA